MIRNILLALMVMTAPAAAQGTRDHAGYGPASLCVGGYAAALHDGEAAIISNGGVRLRGEKLDSMQAQPETGFRDTRKFETSSLTLPGIGAIAKYSYPRQGVFRPGIPGEVVGVEEAAHNEYVLPAAGAEPAVRVTSSAFDGKDDLAVLARFSRRAGTCDALPEDVSGRLGQEVMGWSQVRRKGPTDVCESALAIHVGAGEEAQRSWENKSGDASWYYWRVSGPGWQATVFGGSSLRKNRPAGTFATNGYTVSRHQGGAILSPPASYPKDIDDFGTVYLNTSGLDEQALTAFLDRLQWLAPGKRCPA